MSELFYQCMINVIRQIVVLKKHLCVLMSMKSSMITGISTLCYLLEFINMLCYLLEFINMLCYLLEFINKFLKLGINVCHLEIKQVTLQQITVLLHPAILFSCLVSCCPISDLFWRRKTVAKHNLSLISAFPCQINQISGKHSTE